VDPRAGLGEMVKRKFLPTLELELRTVGRPAHSQSLYRLRLGMNGSYEYIAGEKGMHI
jgi:hypothetical protein